MPRLIIKGTIVNIPDLPGVYCITNTVTGQMYVGSSVKSIKSRIRYHIRDLKANKHHSPKLQNSWSKYGQDSFDFKCLELCDKENCLKIEQSYIDRFLPFFNVNPTAGNCLGRKFSEESKIKMSISAKKRKLPEALVKNQQSKAVFNSSGEKKCIKCLDFKKPELFRTNICKNCAQMNAKSRAIPGAKEAYAQKLSYGKIIAKNEQTILEFKSLRDVERSFTFKKVNKTTIKRYLNTNQKYLGFNWELISA